MERSAEKGEGERVKAGAELRAGTAQVWVAPGGRSRPEKEIWEDGSSLEAEWPPVRWHFAFRGPFSMCGARSLLS